MAGGQDRKTCGKGVTKLGEAAARRLGDSAASVEGRVTGVGEQRRVP